MTKTYATKEKILQINNILHEKTDETNVLTTTSIIKELQKKNITAQKKSVAADISILKTFYDNTIQCNPNLKGFQVVSRIFDKSELLAIASAIMSSKFLNEKKSKELIDKLKSLTSCYEGKPIEKLIQNIRPLKTDANYIIYNI
jgi:hypothetical protein